MHSEQGIKIIRYDPNLNQENFSKLEEAYLNLLNEKDSLKFLSESNLLFDSNTISSFLKNAHSEEVEYNVALTTADEIIGVSAFKCDVIKGFDIIGVVVDQNYRLKGIGNALINKGIEEADKKGFKAVDISVFADNRSMLILLIKLGFKPIKIENHARFDGEDLVHLKKYL